MRGDVSLGFAEGDAALLERQALPGEGQPIRAMEQLEQGGGVLHLWELPGEGRPSERPGLVEGRGVEGGGGQGGNDGRDFRLVLVLPGQQVSAPIQGHRALADEQAKLGAQEIDYLGIREVFLVEPDAQAFAPRRV